MPADADLSTSPGIIIFILLALAALLYAWWLSIDRSRRLRQLIRWLKEHRTQAWSEIPRPARATPNSGIEYLRQHGLADDPQFTRRYRDATRHGKRRIAMLLLAAAGIAVVFVGTSYWGWVW